MKILVTGGAGFIGSHIVDALLKKGEQVTVIDDFDSYYDPKIKRKNLAIASKSKNFELIEGDILDLATIKRAIGDVDAVIHEAAQAGVRVSMDNPLRTLDVNVRGTANLLVAAREIGTKKIILASSSSVYGKVKYLPFDEKHPLEPISPYGVSKLTCEHLAMIFSKTYGITIPILRYFTVFGPRIRPDLAINIFMHNAMKNEQIRVFGDGNKSRSFTYIDDVVDATLLALEKGKSEPYNIGGEQRISINELINKIMKITKSKSPVHYEENVIGDTEHTMASNTRAKEKLGWKPKISIDEGLQLYYQWIKSNY